jgi:glutamate dehydrogenase/leucine dehydrogenase
VRVESLHTLRALGVEIIIAIDSTDRGPALGGCRWKPYADPLAARAEAVALAGAMTRKASLARLWLGGGKAVVVGDPATRTPEQLRAFGSLVDELGGLYITAADMGTGAEEMAVIRESTPHVVGLPERLGGCGEPSPFTAEGVCMAIAGALAQGGAQLRGSRVAIQGAGHVGLPLAEMLVHEGANVVAADPCRASLESLRREVEVEVVSVDDILSVECDVFSPCGPPSVLDPQSVAGLRCNVVCGAANNQLSAPEVAPLMEERGILYVPDFLANAGGLIHLAVALGGGDAEESRRRLNVIPENLDHVLAMAKAEAIDVATAAERMAMAGLSLAE